MSLWEKVANWYDRHEIEKRYDFIEIHGADGCYSAYHSLPLNAKTVVAQIIKNGFSYEGTLFSSLELLVGEGIDTISYRDEFSRHSIPHPALCINRNVTRKSLSP